MTASPLFWVIMVAVWSPVIILIPVAIRHSRRERLLSTSGTRAVGRVLELGRSHDDLGGSSDWIKVEYTLGDGHLYTSRVPVRHGIRDYRVGQRVSVTCVPSRSLVRLDS
jgi:hypothetical protein